MKSLASELRQLAVRFRRVRTRAAYTSACAKGFDVFNVVGRGTRIRTQDGEFTLRFHNVIVNSDCPLEFRMTGLTPNRPTLDEVDCWVEIFKVGKRMYVTGELAPVPEEPDTKPMSYQRSLQTAVRHQRGQEAAFEDAVEKLCLRFRDEEGLPVNPTLITIPGTPRSQDTESELSERSQNTADVCVWLADHIVAEPDTSGPVGTDSTTEARTAPASRKKKHTAKERETVLLLTLKNHHEKPEAEPLSIKELAEMLNCSSSTVCNTFKRLIPPDENGNPGGHKGYLRAHTNGGPNGVMVRLTDGASVPDGVVDPPDYAKDFTD